MILRRLQQYGPQTIRNASNAEVILVLNTTDRCTSSLGTTEITGPCRWSSQFEASQGSTNPLPGVTFTATTSLKGSGPSSQWRVQCQRHAIELQLSRARSSWVRVDQLAKFLAISELNQNSLGFQVSRAPLSWGLRAGSWKLVVNKLINQDKSSMSQPCFNWTHVSTRSTKIHSSQYLQSHRSCMAVVQVQEPHAGGGWPRWRQALVPWQWWRGPKGCLGCSILG